MNDSKPVTEKIVIVSLDNPVVFYYLSAYQRDQIDYREALERMVVELDSQNKKLREGLKRCYDRTGLSPWLTREELDGKE